jgi:DNA-binding PadR family transcriptional regulator
MTTAEVQVVALSWEVRLSEQDTDCWFVVEHELLPAAHRLEGKGWLERRIREDVQWRLTDQGLQTLRTDTIRQAHSAPN